MFTVVPTITTGDVATAAWGNTYLKDNFDHILTAGGLLKHEVGGMEVDVSAITTGGVVKGASAGVMAILARGAASLVLQVNSGGTDIEWGAGPIISTAPGVSWCSVLGNGTLSAGSKNITSINRTAVGCYTITWDNDYDAVTYVVNGTGAEHGATGVDIDARAVGSCTVEVYATTNYTKADREWMALAVGVFA